MISAVLPLVNTLIYLGFFHLLSCQFSDMLIVYHLLDASLSISFGFYLYYLESTFIRTIIHHRYQLPAQIENSSSAIALATVCKGSQQTSVVWTGFATQIVSPCLHHKMSHGMGTMLVGDLVPILQIYSTLFLMRKKQDFLSQSCFLSSLVHLTEEGILL